ncbi:uncharacterized protein EAE97_009585 [Botrytis byssoidea]|uniref:Uncharacterized protein n=1 Tax=Botrytis byssoidea TaxID=139641 RepID=A0A9P5I226_9HELO|nr:uncharacterized protein EAE97_009585 [Botrytis byssoidea]KAF7929988.1 hypothetical protein EAE97_009585 [Botrytis byssoidea]
MAYSIETVINSSGRYETDGNDYKICFLPQISLKTVSYIAWSVHSIFIWGFYRECFDVALSTTLITVFIFECLIPFKLLEEVYEQSLYISVEFSEWPPRFVPGYEHASVQLRLARELEEELRFREFEKRLARVCARLGGKMDSEFIEAWIARDFEVIENIYLRKVHAGLNISVADYIENMVLGTYGDALRLRDLRLTALENLENYGMIVE